jgi:hypothetical protein
MRNQSSLALVKLQCFVQATRDSGYKSAAYALAELIDNAIEAQAERVDVEITSALSGASSSVDCVTITDDGTGMSPDTLTLALQFGGSTRFDSRSGPGRFGMGLPNSSLSQARRTDVISWERRSEVWTTFLDVDQVLSGKNTRVPTPKKISYAAKTKSGTIVRLTRCDRFQFRTISEAQSRLKLELGRLFREAIFQGIALRVNGELVSPLDPLYLRSDEKMAKAAPFGPPLVYKIRCSLKAGASDVTVSFTQLPLAKWNGLSNQEKNKMGIAKGAGVSILRAGREIDYGWYFMGTKRKENYDDWWRCEIRFDPDLDEAFGVTHTKQGIRPTEALEALLAPDLERIARELNSKVRRQYAAIKAAAKQTSSLLNVDKRDHLLEPPNSMINALSDPKATRVVRNSTLGGLKYTVQSQPSSEENFYEVFTKGVHVTIILNELHPFYERLYRRMPPVSPGTRQTPVLENLKALLAAAARAELAYEAPSDRAIILKFRRSWSNALVAFLS